MFDINKHSIGLAGKKQKKAKKLQKHKKTKTNLKDKKKIKKKKTGCNQLYTVNKGYKSYATTKLIVH